MTRRGPYKAADGISGGLGAPGAACVLWTRACSSDGYGHLTVKGRTISAHRLAYELHVGPIPEGLEIDHLCGQRRCVNPAHLEAVTHAENVRRGRLGAVTAARQRAKTHCPNGHAYTPENTYRRTDRHSRECRACARERARASRGGQ